MIKCPFECQKTSKISLNRVLGVTKQLIFSSFLCIFCSNFQDMSKTVILAYASFLPRYALFAHFWANQKIFFLSIDEVFWPTNISKISITNKNKLPPPPPLNFVPYPNFFPSNYYEPSSNYVHSPNNFVLCPTLNSLTMYPTLSQVSDPFPNYVSSPLTMLFSLTMSPSLTKSVP